MDAKKLHHHRVRRMLALASGVTMVVSVVWGGYFAFKGWWPLVGADIFVFGVALLSAYWLRRNHFLRSGLLLLGSLALVLSFQALFLDIPSPLAPRSVHLYLLPLLVFSLVVFRQSHPWLRGGAAGLCLGLFVVFSSWPHGLSMSLQLPEPFRMAGTWVNAVLATATMGGLLYILQSDKLPMSVLEQELRRAVEAQQMVLHYQPQVDDRGQVRGAEALVRWQHPVSGIIPPGEFIPLAEDSGLIVAIGDQVLRQAGQQLALWSLQPSFAHLTLSVNVSAQQITQDDFVSKVLAVVQDNGIEPGRLRLELTESMLVKDMNLVTQKVAELQAHGVGFALDDFGTGFSSLSYLKRLPLDELKIDKSFIDDLATDESDRAIVKSLLVLGEQLGLMVVAEGVESQLQWQALRDCGCRVFQGYWFSKPEPLERFEAYVDASEIRQKAGVSLVPELQMMVG